MAWLFSVKLEQVLTRPGSLEAEVFPTGELHSSRDSQEGLAKALLGAAELGRGKRYLALPSEEATGIVA